MKAYHVATEEELDKLGYCNELDLLIGPDGFECFLGEPEDRTWRRDAAAVVDELNQLRADAMILALRLMGESESSFAPETHEVMTRWRVKCLKLIGEIEGGSTP